MDRNAVPSFNRTRLAPTPSGFLHLGNVYNFALTAALARKHNARILLRIDDLDQQRVNPAYLQDIFDTLHFLDIPYDEGPADAEQLRNTYSQLHRLQHYALLLDRLRNAGLLFACTCSRTAVLKLSPDGGYPGTCRHRGIPLDQPGVAWRLRTDQAIALQIRQPDNALQAALPQSQRDFVVRKKDGYPAYQLASLADDLHFGVDLIVRGQDLFDSTLAQLYLAHILAEPLFLDSTFIHHRLLPDNQGQKLSKSAGSMSVQYLRRSGLSASTIFTRIADAAGVGGGASGWRDFLAAY